MERQESDASFRAIVRGLRALKATELGESNPLNSMLQSAGSGTILFESEEISLDDWTLGADSFGGSLKPAEKIRRLESSTDSRASKIRAKVVGQVLSHGLHLANYALILGAIADGFQGVDLTLPGRSEVAISTLLAALRLAASDRLGGNLPSLEEDVDFAE